MRMRAGVVLVLLALAGLGLTLASLRREVEHPTTVVGPGVLEALERQPDVEVDIALRRPIIPFVEQTTAYMRKYSADTQARVLSAVTAGDFTLIYQFPLSPFLSGRITASGLKKLASHPDVVAIELPTIGSWGTLEFRP